MIHQNRASVPLPFIWPICICRRYFRAIHVHCISSIFYWTRQWAYSLCSLEFDCASFSPIIKSGRQSISVSMVRIFSNYCSAPTPSAHFLLFSSSISDAPKSWRYQTCIYIGLMALVKLSTTLFIQWRFWNSVKDLVLLPFAFSNETIELILFMLVIPFFVNLLIFWVTDNFLMRHDHIHQKRSFFVDYIGRFKKRMPNGNGGSGFTTNGSINGHNSTNGKHLFSDSHSFLDFPQHCIDYRSKYQAVPDVTHRFDRSDYSSSHSLDDDIDFNRDEFDALISGDERFDIDLIDDDCARLEPKHL